MAGLMIFSKLFSREVFIRLEDGDAFVSTVKYGRFYSKTKEFGLDGEPELPGRNERATALPEHLVPRAAAPMKKRSGL